jgi:DNA-binding MarR family transcriptional regulator
MLPFEKLRALRRFRKEHPDIFGTLEGQHLVSEIGFHQANGEPLTLKQLFLIDISSIATVQRRLRRLKELGLVRHRQLPVDRRSIELILSPKCLRIYEQYDVLMSSDPAPGAAGNDREARHVCGLCDSNAGSRNLLVAFLAQGLTRGDKCVLVAPSENQGRILAELPLRRGASEQLLVSQGDESCTALLAWMRQVAWKAKQAGQRLCLAGDMSWALARNVALDTLMDFEKRLDAFARKGSPNMLCVYDTRLFSGGEFLHAVKCHRDHARYPIETG